MAVIGSNTFVVDAQDLASAKFKQIAETHRTAVEGMIRRTEDLAAGVGTLQAPFRSVTLDTDKFAASIKALSGSSAGFKLPEDLTLRMKAVGPAFDNAAKGAKTYVDSADKLVRTQNSARMATFSLTQAIQDAPYGFRGVANNIEFLTQNLVTLSAQAGGATGAMKAIGATLAGPVGILFAVSAVSAAIQFLVPQFGQMGGAANDAEKKLKAAADELERFYSIAEKRSATPLAQKVNVELLQRQYELLQKIITAKEDKRTETFVLPDSASEAVKVELQGFVSENSKKSLKELRDLAESLKTEIKAAAAAAQTITSVTDSVEKGAKDAADRAKEASKAAQEANAQEVKYWESVAKEQLKAQARWEKYIATLRVVPTSLPEVKEIKPPKIDFSNDPIIAFINQLERLGPTVENVNGLILDSVQGLASAMTDAFFGATKSIGEFFEQMLKNIVRMILEAGISKAILSLIPGASTGGSILGALGSIFGLKTTAKGNTAEGPVNSTAIRASAENIPPITVPAPKVAAPKPVTIPAPKVETPKVPTITVPAPRVIVPRPVTVETPARTQRVQSAATQAAPVTVSSPKTFTVNINLGNTTKESRVSDRRRIMRDIEKAVMTERFA